MTINAGNKIWGQTTPLIVTPMFELHRLDINPNHRCSFHMHRFKHNAFVVLTGVLYLDVGFGSGMPPRRLRAGETATIPPGIPHNFRTGPIPCTALEMYYPEALSEDIQRFDVGCAV